VHKSPGSRRSSLPGTWESAKETLAEDAVVFRAVALTSLNDHVLAAAELAYARVCESGGDQDAEVTAIMEAICDDVARCLAKVEAVVRGRFQ
jgi:hypothetical protein